ncbi:Inosine/uridine-preferring nucleoside hydrolase domain-containing protein [Xylogone sp. PMI_703]|nr:Inosine/uridine-preferring nucleoside hydrolase domain-containing protein [Xylogone sp. PMI_703]
MILLHLVTACLVYLASAATASSSQLGFTKNKVIIDNDFTAGQWDPYLLALNSGWEVLGLTTCTGNTWMPQQVLHALGNLEYGGLSCIPVYAGALYPLINTYELFQAWQLVHGAIPYQGAFGPYNKTAEALGSDPSGGSNPYRIVKGAFTEGYPTIKAQESQDAVTFMIDQVRKYPGEVTIFAAGAMTNVALAVRADPKFASMAKELVIMGGYIDVNLYQVTGSVLQADINSDFNLIMDPEAAKIILTADFPHITMVGNVGNSIYPDEKWLSEVSVVDNFYTRWSKKYLDFQLPFWDSIAGAIMVEPSLTLNKTNFYVDVDTSYASPSYGNIHAYQHSLAPPKLQNITYVLEVNETRFKELLKEVYQKPKTCANLH